jgi:hypothetical protein
LLENQFQRLDVNHKDKEIQVEEIHQYNHDNLYNQLMVELEKQEQDKVHHQTKNKRKFDVNIKYKIKNFYHLWIHIFFKISFT